MKKCYVIMKKRDICIYVCVMYRLCMYVCVLCVVMK